MKKHILCCLLIAASLSAPAQRRYDDSFPTLSNPAPKERIADETTYQPINGRKAIVVTYNDSIAGILQTAIQPYIRRHRYNSRHQRHVFTVTPCRKAIISLLN